MENDIIKQQFLAATASLTGFAAPAPVRQKAVEAFLRHTVPDRTGEEWRQTDLRDLLSHQYQSAQKLTVCPTSVSVFGFPEFQGNLLVFVNGHYCPQYSRLVDPPEVIHIESLALSESRPEMVRYFETTQVSQAGFFAALNTAFAADGVLIVIPPRAEPHNIMLLFLTHDNSEYALVQPRNLIIAGRNSRAGILESYRSFSDNPAFVNSVDEIVVEDGAHLSFNVVQHIGCNDYQINTVRVRQAQNSVFTSNTITLSGKLVRNDVKIEMPGQNAQSALNGLYLPVGTQHFDNYTCIEHQAPHCTSNQVFRGIVDDSASAVYFGKVCVDRQAQKTDAYQSNRNILLTPQAKVHSKPQLEIYADDVKCSHGSTTGQLDQEAIFYLRARGISETDARLMLLEAFVGDVLDRIDFPTVKQYLAESLARRFSREFKTSNPCSEHKSDSPNA